MAATTSHQGHATTCDRMRPHFPISPTRAHARAWRDTDNVVACGRKVSGGLRAEEVGAGRGLLWRERRKGPTRNWRAAARGRNPAFKGCTDGLGPAAAAHAMDTLAGVRGSMAQLYRPGLNGKIRSDEMTRFIYALK